MLIVAVTGMPGAGKSTAAKALAGKGWKRVVMGDVIRKETVKAGLEPNAKNTGDVMSRLRKERGDSAVADLCLEEIRKEGADRVVVDGIRSLAEVDRFRMEAHVLLVAIHASPERRFALLKERGRSDDPLSREMFVARDDRELAVGIGSAVALADEVIANEHATPGRLATQIVEVVERWVKSVER